MQHVLGLRIYNLPINNRNYNLTETSPVNTEGLFSLSKLTLHCKDKPIRRLLMISFMYVNFQPEIEPI